MYIQFVLTVLLTLSGLAGPGALTVRKVRVVGQTVDAE